MTKKNIATKAVVPMGAMWDLATSYCPCGWSLSLRAKRFDTMNAENAELRAQLADTELLRQQAAEVLSAPSVRRLRVVEAALRNLLKAADDAVRYDPQAADLHTAAEAARAALGES